MEKQEIQKTEIVKARSYVASLREGLRFPLLHFGELVRFLWPVALLVSLVCTMVQVMETLLLLGPTSPQLTDRGLWIEVGAMELLQLFVLALFGGHVLYQQCHLATTGLLPKSRPWQVWKSLLSPSWRALVTLFLTGLYFLLGLVAGIWGAVSHRPLWLLVGLLLFVILLTHVPVILEYIFTDVSFWKSPRQAKWRYTGGTLIVYVMAGLLAIVGLLLAALPFLLITLIDVQVHQALLMGDMPVVPSYFVLLRALFGFLYMLGAQYVSLFLVYPLLFRWGATTAIDRERQAYAKSHPD